MSCMRIRQLERRKSLILLVLLVRDAEYVVLFSEEKIDTAVDKLTDKFVVHEPGAPSTTETVTAKAAPVTQVAQQQAEQAWQATKNVVIEGVELVKEGAEYIKDKTLDAAHYTATVLGVGSETITLKPSDIKASRPKSIQDWTGKTKPFKVTEKVEVPPQPTAPSMTDKLAQDVDIAKLKISETAAVAGQKISEWTGKAKETVSTTGAAPESTGPTMTDKLAGTADTAKVKISDTSSAAGQKISDWTGKAKETVTGGGMTTSTLPESTGPSMTEKLSEGVDYAKAKISETAAGASQKVSDVASKTKVVDSTGAGSTTSNLEPAVGSVTPESVVKPSNVKAAHISSIRDV